MILQMTTTWPEANIGRVLDGLEEECPGNGETVTRGPLAAFQLQSAQFTGVSPDVSPMNGFDRDTLARPDAHASTSDSTTPMPLFMSPNHEFELPFPHFPEQEFSVDLCALDWRSMDTDTSEPTGPDRTVLDQACGSNLCLLPAPDDFSPIIPSNVKFLWDHFAEQYVDVVSLIQNPKSPWRILHLPSVLMTFGELIIWKSPNCFRIALFYAIFALSSFHLDRTSGAAEGLGYWWTVGSSHYKQAASELRKGLAQEVGRAPTAKYKDILMAFLTMITVCITSGKMEDARSYLLQAEVLVRSRGLPKRHKSRKVKILHSIFVFLRTIEESTFAYPISSQSLCLVAAKSDLSTSRYPSFDLHHTDALQTSPQPTSTEAWADLAEVEPEGNGRSTFSQVYGIPESLFVLMSHISCLTQQVRLLRAQNASVDPLLFREMDKSTNFSEEMHGHQNAPATPLVFHENALGLPGMHPSTKGGIGGSSLTTPTEHMALAIHSALLIYFYRQVRDVHPLILQPLVKQVKDHLLACESYKEQNSIASSSLAWPGFIAAVEAHDEDDFEELTVYLKSCGDRSGLRNFDRAASIATEIRSTRCNSPTPYRENWMDVLQAREIALVCS